MMKNEKQYNWLIRISAASLGVPFIIISIYILVNSLISSSGFTLYQLAAIPLLAFGVLLTHTAWLGNDPLWFYNSIDVSEHNQKQNDAQSSNK